MTKRQYKLLGLLKKTIRHGNDYLPLKDVILVMEVSERTIRNDLKELEELLPKGEKLLKRGLVTFSSNQIMLIEANLEKKSDLSGELRDLVVFLLLSFKEGLTINKLCSFTGYSRSTIKQVLKRYQSLLVKNELTLDSLGRQGFKLQGDEFSIRKFQICIWKEYQDKKDILGNKNDDLIKELNINDNYNLAKEIISFILKERIISDPEYSLLFNYIYISLVRLKMGYNIKMITNLNFYKNTIEFKEIKEAIIPIIKVSSIDEKLISEAELALFTDFFLAIHPFNKNSAAANPWLETEFLTRDLIKSFSKIYGVYLLDDTQLLQGLDNHLKPAIYRIQRKLTLEASLYDDFIEAYPLVLASLKTAIRRIEDFLDLVFSSEELAFIGMHFQMALDRKQTIQTPHKVLLVCSLGYGTSKFLAAELQKHFYLEVVDTISYNYLTKLKELPKVDFIITNLEFPFVKWEEKVIRVPLFLNQNSYLKLKEVGFVKRVNTLDYNSLITILDRHLDLTKHQELIKELTPLFPNNKLQKKTRYLSELLKENNIHLKKTPKGWVEAINIIGDNFESRGVVFKGYKEGLINNIREYGSYMVTEPGVALPHYKPSLTKVTAMELIIFDDKIAIGKEAFQVMLGFTSIDNSEHLQALTDFLNLIENHNFYEFLLESPTPKRIIERIKKYEFLKYLGR